MNILIILEQYPQLGGVEHMSELLANSLIKSGQKVYVFAEKGNSGIKNKFHEKIKLIYTTRRNNSISLINALKKFEIDLIINQGCYPRITKLLHEINKRIRIPYLISVLHNSPNASIYDMNQSLNIVGFKSILKRAIYPIYKSYTYYRIEKNIKRINQLSQKIVLLSDSFINEYKQWDKNICNSKIEVIPNFTTNRPKSFIYKDYKTIIYAGRVLEAQKRISKLIKIWGKLHSKYADWKLNIIGDGPDLKNISQAINTMGIKNIYLYGYRSNIEDFYRRSNIIVLTSDYEGLPMCLLEGMNYGCIPVVFNSFSSAEDIINNNVDGIIVPSEDKENGFALTLEGLMNNERRRNEMAYNSYLSSIRYTKDIIMPKWQILIGNSQKNN